MSMDKRWSELFARLEAVECALKDLQGEQVYGETLQTAVPEWETLVTKDDLMAIKGVGAATADEILEILFAKAGNQALVE